MKIHFIIGFIFNTALCSTVLPDFESDYRNRNLLLSSHNRFYNTVSAEVINIDLKISSLILTSHLLFDSFKLQQQLLFYDPIEEPDISFLTLNASSSIRKFQLQKNPQLLKKVISSRLLNRSIALKKINEEEFKYAGSQRFTLSGDLPNKSTQIKPLQASLALSATVVTGIALHINQSTAWWDGKGTSFYIYDDWDDVLFADKFGHFMGGYFISYTAREAFVFSGFGWDQSIFLGSLFGLIAQSYVEFKDGYAQNTGFSPSDFVADFAGVTFFYLQHYVPFLQNFSPKWQYVPPAMIGVPPKAQTQSFLDNYNSTTAWISVHIRNLFWRNKESTWPKWLNIGFGYGVNGYYSPDIQSRFIIGIDYNIVELLPDWLPFWNWLKQSMNLIKLPSPAIEFSREGTKFKLLYPFSISIDSIKF